MFQKFFSRKFIAAGAAFITINIIPKLPAANRAMALAILTAAYALAQGYADAHAPGQPSQGDTAAKQGA